MLSPDCVEILESAKIAREFWNNVPPIRASRNHVRKAGFGGKMFCQFARLGLHTEFLNSISAIRSLEAAQRNGLTLTVVAGFRSSFGSVRIPSGKDTEMGLSVVSMQSM